MPTFPLGHSSSKLSAKHATQAKREARGVNTTAGPVSWVQDPVDLRGLPMIGRNVGGAIRDTQPERALIGKQPRE